MGAHSHSDSFSYRPIGKYDFEEFIDMAIRFHNYPAPGLLVGGYMVEEAKRQIPRGVLYEAIAETGWCLPDAVQMLTPCTIGNGWLRVVHHGVYGLVLYDKFTGEGIRVWLDIAKFPKDSEIRTWYLKLRPKIEQDSDRLRHEIGMLGSDILSSGPVKVRKQHLGKRSKGRIVICPGCGEAYPAKDGNVCKICQGNTLYEPMPGMPKGGFLTGSHPEA
ncbi:trehalose-binding protein [Desulfoplanes formicivorans]|uniref:Trehalose-binding protein n=2 Tax=Desulfoplanes formicivorans TaxID=1592317 RepID=A0A194ALW0_9BACT|nr:trehalose-binding protein [Desulfoplanes formicivorans]